MSTRPEVAAILGTSERTLRRYLSEFSAFLSSDRDLSDFDLELLKVIHAGKRTGQNTGQEIRNHLLELIRKADKVPASLSDTTTSVQNSRQPQVQPTETGGQNLLMTQQDLLNALRPFVALVEGLRNDVRNLSAQLAPSAPVALTSSTAPKVWRPMPLHPPSPRLVPKPVSWWRAILRPELQRNG